jgi:hypothetical protein
VHTVWNRRAGPFAFRSLKPDSSSSLPIAAWPARPAGDRGLCRRTRPSRVWAPSAMQRLAFRRSCSMMSLSHAGHRRRMPRAGRRVRRPLGQLGGPRSATSYSLWCVPTVLRSAWGCAIRLCSSSFRMPATGTNGNLAPSPVQGTAELSTVRGLRGGCWCSRPSAHLSGIPPYDLHPCRDAFRLLLDDPMPLSARPLRHFFPTTTMAPDRRQSR